MDFNSFLVQKQKIAFKYISSSFKMLKKSTKVKSFLAFKSKDTKSFVLSAALVLFMATLMFVRLADAKDLRSKNIKPVTLEQTPENSTPAEPEVVTQAVQSPAASVETVAPAPAPVKTAPKPKTQTTTKKPAPKQTTPSTSNAVSTSMNQSGILSQINSQRRANGLGNTSLNAQLSSVALAKAKHMADHNYFAHTAPDGTTDFDFVKSSGYNSWTSAGVNLAMGDFSDAKDLVDAWMNSEGHKKNILASYGKVVGIGVYGKYFVMIIAN